MNTIVHSLIEYTEGRYTTPMLFPVIGERRGALGVHYNTPADEVVIDEAGWAAKRFSFVYHGPLLEYSPSTVGKVVVHGYTEACNTPTETTKHFAVRATLYRYGKFLESNDGGAARWSLISTQYDEITLPLAEDGRECRATPDAIATRLMAKMMMQDTANLLGTGETEMIGVLEAHDPRVSPNDLSPYIWKATVAEAVRDVTLEPVMPSLFRQDPRGFITETCAYLTNPVSGRAMQPNEIYDIREIKGGATLSELSLGNPTEISFKEFTDPAFVQVENPPYQSFIARRIFSDLARVEWVNTVKNHEAIRTVKTTLSRKRTTVGVSVVEMDIPPLPPLPNVAGLTLENIPKLDDYIDIPVGEQVELDRYSIDKLEYCIEVHQYGDISATIRVDDDVPCRFRMPAYAMGLDKAGLFVSKEKANELADALENFIKELAVDHSFNAHL